MTTPERLVSYLGGSCGSSGMLVAALAFVGLAVGCASAPETGGESSDEEVAESSESDQTEGEKEQEGEGEEREAAAEEGESEAESTTQAPAEPKTTAEAGERVETGVEAAEQGNLEQAEQVFEQIPDDDERVHLGAYNLGVVAEMNGEVGDAARQYGRALEKNPDFSPALVNLVRLYLRQGDVEEARRIASKYTEKRPENLDHRAAELEVKIARGHYEEAIDQARSILRRDERNVAAMVAMAKANFRLERYELTKAVLERAAELSPERADIYFLFGLVAGENDETSRAISNFQKAIEYNGRFAEAYNHLGRLYFDAGDHAGAAEQFQEAIDHRPGFVDAMINLGNAYKGMGELKKAEKQFQEVLEQDSDNALAYFNLGVLYLDASIPGMDKIPRLEKSIEMLNEYKRASRDQLDDNDPTDGYIKSAREKIKAEKQRQEMMRQSQKGSGSNGGSNGGSQEESGGDSEGESDDDSSGDTDESD